MTIGPILDRFERVAHPQRAILKFALCVGVLVMAGCASSVSRMRSRQYISPGAIEQNGFRHIRYGYRVATIPGGSALAGDDWVLENFYLRDGTWHPKESDRYLERYSFDIDGDGKPDLGRRLPGADLRFEHRRNGAVMWVSTVPVSERRGELDLHVVAQQHVEWVAGGEGYATLRPGRILQSTEHRYATRMLGVRDTALSGYSALEFTFEVANVDQLELSRTTRAQVVRMLLLRPDALLTIGSADFPVLMVLGYSAMPDAFDSTLEDWADLVRRIDFKADRELDGRREAVLACRPTTSTQSLGVRLNVDEVGHVWNIHLWPGAGTQRGHGAATDTERKVEQCVVSALADPVRLRGTGSPRTVVWTFEAGPPAATTDLQARFQTAPLGRSSDVDDDTSPIAAELASAVPGQAPVEASQAPDADAEAALRAAIDQRSADLLACAASERVRVELSYDAGTLAVQLGGELSGSAEEGCIRHLLQDLSAPPGHGRLVHLVH